MNFRPCIDLHNGKVKQIVGGSLTGKREDVKENFVSSHDAAYYAELYRKDSLKGGHVIMLGPGNNDEALKALKAYPGGLQVGGGINDENAEFYIDKGASHVIITSFVFKEGKINFNNLEKIIKKIGKEKLVLDLSCRLKDNKYYVVTDRWQNFTEFIISEKNIKLLENHCDEFLIHAADVEGKCSGIEKGLVSMLGDMVKIPTTYAGGIKDFSDIDLIYRLGKGRLDYTVGSALDIFGGSISYNDVVKWKPWLKKS